MFYSFLKESSKNILEVYYDEYKCLTIILKSNDVIEKLISHKYMPLCIEKIEYSKEYNCVLFQFKGEEHLDNTERKRYFELVRVLNIDIFKLDKNHGKKVINYARNKLEKKYINQIINGYMISIINIKYNFKQDVPVNILFDLFGGIKCIYRLPFAMLFSYKKHNLLFYYNQVKYSELIDSIKRQCSHQYYLKNSEDYDLLNYMIYRKNIINKIDNEQYYLNRESVLDVDNLEVYSINYIKKKENLYV